MSTQQEVNSAQMAPSSPLTLRAVCVCFCPKLLIIIIQNKSNQCT